MKIPATTKILYYYMDCYNANSDLIKVMISSRRKLLCSHVNLSVGGIQNECEFHLCN